MSIPHSTRISISSTPTCDLSSSSQEQTVDDDREDGEIFDSSSNFTTEVEDGQDLEFGVGNAALTGTVGLGISGNLPKSGKVPISPVSPFEEHAESISIVKPKWIFTQEDLASTPSIQRGMTMDDETILRQVGVQLISRIHQELFRIGSGKDRLNPPPRTVCSASVFFHRFFMFHPFQIFHPLEIATTCYFLASKTEERPRTCDEIIRATQYILAGGTTGTIFERGVSYYEIKKVIWSSENILMQTLNFEHIVEHPFTHHAHVCMASLKGISTSKINSLMRRLNYYFEESLSSSICLQWNASTIAIVFMILSCNQEIVPVQAWHNLIVYPEFYKFGKCLVTLETVEKIGYILRSNIGALDHIWPPDTCTNIINRSTVS